VDGAIIHPCPLGVRHRGAVTAGDPDVDERILQEQPGGVHRGCGDSNILEALSCSRVSMAASTIPRQMAAHPAAMVANNGIRDRGRSS
jgi:hypothetical protein